MKNKRRYFSNFQFRDSITINKFDDFDVNISMHLDVLRKFRLDICSILYNQSNFNPDIKKGLQLYKN